jgi:hypothetical protein
MITLPARIQAHCRERTWSRIEVLAAAADELPEHAHQLPLEGERLTTRSPFGDQLP